ncbi:hypothetical protein V8E52_011034 [Russula decolorans]|jgi:hypothetical protein
MNERRPVWTFESRDRDVSLNRRPSRLPRILNSTALAQGLLAAGLCFFLDLLYWLSSLYHSHSHSHTIIAVLASEPCSLQCHHRPSSLLLIYSLSFYFFWAQITLELFIHKLATPGHSFRAFKFLSYFVSTRQHQLTASATPLSTLCPC